MPDFLLELFSEDIPARMQAHGAATLARLIEEALSPLSPRDIAPFYTPRRIALTAQISAAAPETIVRARGPRLDAPVSALEGFLRKHNARREEAQAEDGYWRLETRQPAQPAATLIVAALPALLWRFPWPKSMRWGESAFAWVRPLRRILCLLDDAPVPFTLAHPDDAAHSLCGGAETEGHRFMAPGVFPVSSIATWKEGLRARKVMLDPAERRARIAADLAALAGSHGLCVTDDPGLLDEVTGLVEWPLPLLGRIDEGFMDLPPEVRQVSMRVNQRYFALHHPDGSPAPFFAFVANIEAADGGASIVAGNERVLRARFADARHFWDLDRRVRLEDRLEALHGVTFHADIGTQWVRMMRLVALAGSIAASIGADVQQAQRAAKLAKADLTASMVGEFPELQGVMGCDYARHDGEDPIVANAIRDHYLPKGVSDDVPREPVAIAVALADRIDQLTSFFNAGIKSSGSSDPFALRRAAVGIIRIILENNVHFRLHEYAQCATDIGLIMKYIDALSNDTIQHDSDVCSIVDECIQKYFESGIEYAKNYLLNEFHAGKPIRRYRQFRSFPEDELRKYRFSNELKIQEILDHRPNVETLSNDITTFILDRLQANLKTKGIRHDLITAILRSTDDTDLVRLVMRVEVLERLAESEIGQSLVQSYKRADNILRIEYMKDGPHEAAINTTMLFPEEERLLAAIVKSEAQVNAHLEKDQFEEAMAALRDIGPPLDSFFNTITVNDPNPALRRNRLALLNSVRALMNRVADFALIEG